MGFSDSGAFSLAHRDGGPAIHLTPLETLELWNMWERLALTHLLTVLAERREDRKDAHADVEETHA